MINKYLSAYIPSNMDEETLENMFVQRHQLLKQAVISVEESLTTDKKNHLLFIGPQGSGKTHLITMIINRLKKNANINDLLVIWLGEDDVVMNLNNLAVLMINEMVENYPQRFNNDCLAFAKEQSLNNISDIVFASIKEQVGENTLLVVKENMSDVFSNLKDLGQKRLRAYLQENKHISFLGTSQNFFNGFSSRDTAFYGFFDIEHLPILSVEDASQLMSNIASIRQDYELVDFLKSPQGQYRIHALYYLAGGNHRLYVELSNFLNKASLDDFVDAITQLVDHLTPYFQERIRSLSPQQACIIQKLCKLNGAIQVKTIAELLYLDERAVASQLKILKDMGYVVAHPRGRASYYEIAEPLLRLSLEVKNNHGKPLKIIAALFRVWFSNDELKPNTKKNYFSLKSYSESALANKDVINHLKESVRKNIMEGVEKNDDEKIINSISEMLCVQNLLAQAKAKLLLRRCITYNQREIDKQLADIDKVISMKDASNRVVAFILLERSHTYYHKNDFRESLASLNDLDTLIDIPNELNNEKLFFTPVIHYELLETTQARKALKKAFKDGDNASNYYLHHTNEMICSVAKFGMNHWQKEIEFLMDVFMEYDVTSNLSSALIHSIGYFINDEHLTSSFKKWAELWQEAIKDNPEMQLAVSAVNSSVQAVLAGSDRPLFALPQELRGLVIPIFNGQFDA